MVILLVILPKPFPDKQRIAFNLKILMVVLLFAIVWTSISACLSEFKVHGNVFPMEKL